MASDKNLRTLWADVASLQLDPNRSNTRYKFHLARLRDVYLGNRKMSDEMRAWGKRTSEDATLPVPQQFIEPHKLHEKFHEREQKWYNRLVLHENLMHEIDQQDREKSSPQPKSRHHKSEVKTRLKEFSELPINTDDTRYRCLDDNITDDDLIFNGLYKFSAKQRETYDTFVDMLCDYESYDMVKILEDALKDARARTLLVNYGGTILCDESEDSQWG